MFKPKRRFRQLVYNSIFSSSFFLINISSKLLMGCSPLRLVSLTLSDDLIYFLLVEILGFVIRSTLDKCVRKNQSLLLEYMPCLLMLCWRHQGRRREWKWWSKIEKIIQISMKITIGENSQILLFLFLNTPSFFLFQTMQIPSIRTRTQVQFFTFDFDGFVQI